VLGAGCCVSTHLGRWVCTLCGQPWAEKKCSDEECIGGKKKWAGLIPHDLRRSAAKALRRAGVLESVVMAMGGWKTAAMFRRYAIGSNSDQQAAVRMLEAARKQLSPPLAPRNPENQHRTGYGCQRKTSVNTRGRMVPGTGIEPVRSFRNSGF